MKNYSTFSGSKKYLLFFFIFVLILIFSGNRILHSEDNNRIREFIPNVVVVKFNSLLAVNSRALNTGSTSLDAVMGDLGINSLAPVFRKSASLKKPSRFANIYYATYEGSRSPQQVARVLSKNRQVLYAEPKYVNYIEVEPNDSFYPQQEKYYNLIAAPDAWSLVKGEEGPVVVAIVDGGTDVDHPDLADNIWNNPGEIAGNGIDDDGNGYVDDIQGWNFANDSNDPTGLPATFNNGNHGTHTAGITSAVSDNGLGAAGVAWNLKIMPVNVSAVDVDWRIDFGYDGIVYAAENGADIISCSWGSLGNPSLFEQDVIDYASSFGAVVMASAGNNNSILPHYPSSYRRVISIGATNNANAKWSSSNFGPDIDMAAPGDSIFSLLNNGSYGIASGTSMSSPMAAGVVGLVKTQNPGWTNRQAAEQVRVTSDSTVDFNGLLGKGRINAMRALTESSPSIRITDVGYTDTDGDQVIEPGETIQLDIGLINYLAAAGNIELRLTGLSSRTTVITGSANLPALGTLETTSLNSAFSFEVDPGTPSGFLISFRLEIETGNYTDQHDFAFIVQPNYLTMEGNQIQLSVTNIGRIGRASTSATDQGIGFRYQGGPNLLFEGAVIAGTGSNRISNAARDAFSGFDEDFSVAENGELSREIPGQLADEEIFGEFVDDGAGNPMDIKISQETYTWRNNPDLDDFVIFKYTIENTGTTPLNNFHFGLFTDWDIDEISYNSNFAGYDSQRRLGYSFDQNGVPGTYAGIAHLGPGNTHYRAIWNDETLPGNPSWGLYDGYTDAEKWESISGGTAFQSAGPADVSFAIAGGPFNIPAGSAHIIGFALVAGADGAEIATHADSAHAVWQRYFSSGTIPPPPVDPPTGFALLQNRPNPFNPGTSIPFSLTQGGRISVTIYDIRGRKVRTLLDEFRSEGSGDVFWDGRDDSGLEVAGGVYLYRLQTSQFSKTNKMLLLR